ncbi:interleukin-1 beta-like [Genypterus blacodes]|uniref:interleukin-1 beta-like n=1 Tax=Genypterus blacodes TaxID=154954 RepID=UPI003F75BE54
MESEMSCDLMMNSSPIAMWCSKMPQGLALEISQHPLTMRNVVNLIIAMEGFKGSRSESVFSSNKHDTMNIFLESLVEEQIIFERCSTPPQYSKTGEFKCSITDSKKKNWILLRNSMELHAVMLQGGNTEQKVLLNMSTYVHPAPTTEARPVVLGIKDTNLYLSCLMEGDTPTLHLETVEDKASLSTIGTQSDLEHFLFYKQDTGLNSSTLMSACFPGWYISTDDSVNKPVEMCEQTATRNLTFTIQRQS